MNHCKDCVHYTYGGKYDGAIGQGECRRYPPVMTSSKDVEGLWSYSTDWPVVIEHEWCGEFKSSETA